MTRLLFAAARGARIQELHYIHFDEPNWRDCKIVWTGPECEDVHRIHPDDEALQYGPISTVLRKNAKSFDENREAGLPYIVGYFEFTRDEAAVMDTDELHRSLFLLILSEALADEGL